MTMETVANLLSKAPDSLGITIRLAKDQTVLAEILDAKRIELGISISKLRIVTGELQTIVLEELTSILGSLRIAWRSAAR